MRLRRKKTSVSMDHLIEFVNTVLFACGDTCTQCLIDEIAVDSDELAEVIARLKDAHTLRDFLPDGEKELTVAFVDFLIHVTKSAMFTSELLRRPGVRWADDSGEAAPTVIIFSPN